MKSFGNILRLLLGLILAIFIIIGCGDDDDDDSGNNNGSAPPAISTWYADTDGDGYGDPNSSIEAATQPTGYVSDYTDCDDTDASINPGAIEICTDSLDNDCDEKIDCADSDCEDDSVECPICVDEDADGYFTESTCGTEVDCNDNDANINPGATEICGDDIDQDCNGVDLICAIKTNSLGMTFNYIAPGTFTMGSPESEVGRGLAETQYQVTLTEGFYMQTTEVTQSQWQLVMGNNPSGNSDCSNCPVENVSWDQVQDFIGQMNSREEGAYRLPTEAEWEYAARAETTTPFNTGECLTTDQSNYNGNIPYEGCDSGVYLLKTITVASFPSSPWGLYDMHGNVWEWCQDLYGNYPSGPITDPTGETSGSSRVVRGGSWNSAAKDCRSANRFDLVPTYASNFVGVRLVMSLDSNIVNKTPILAQIGSKSINETELLEFTISATDPDGDNLTYSVSDLPAGASFDNTTQTFSWTPGSNASGIYKITFTVMDDGEGSLSDSETITILVNDIVTTISNTLGMNFVYISPGTFTMGSPESEVDRGTSEIQHRVTLTKGFYLQTTEITVGQWLAVMDDNPSYNAGCSNCPVERVSWNNVQDFIAKMNEQGDWAYRLPTEAEWEYAARAETTTPFNTGECLSTDQANYNGNFPYEGCASGVNLSETIIVASFLPNAWGVYDMHGNVWEWCQDWYGNYTSDSAKDPTGPTSGSSRVLRGGSWSNYASYCRSAFRYYLDPQVTSHTVGFRLVLFSVPNTANIAPILMQIGNKTVNEGESLEFIISVTDPGVDSLIYSASNLPTGATFDSNTQTFSWTPDYDDSGTYNVTFIVTKEGGDNLSDSETITIRVIDAIPPDLGMNFVYISPGTFTMGSPITEPDRYSGEIEHQVTLTNGFYLQTTEVTQTQWQTVMGNNPSYNSDCSDCPIEKVSWEDVQNFITAMNKRGDGNYRLPTEAEWEYAARAGTTTPFSTGDCLGVDQANYNGNNPYEGCISGIYRSETIAVASFSPNEWGVYDMHGNVLEWCQDLYGSYPSDAVTDPTGAISGSSRVFRGGGWNSHAQYCRSAFRDSEAPTNSTNTIGFRLVKSADQ